MNHRVILSPDAEEDIESAIRWYVNIDVHLGSRFSAETDAALARVARTPYQYRVIDNPVRRALMNRFPYAIYFTLRPAEIFVISVPHQRRLSRWNTP